MSLENSSSAISVLLKGNWQDSFNNTEFPSQGYLFDQPSHYGAGIIDFQQPYNVSTDISSTTEQITITVLLYVQGREVQMRFLVRKEKMPNRYQVTANINAVIEAESAVQTVLEESEELYTALLLDKETLEMCLENGILSYVRKLDSEIYNIYKNVTAVKYRLLEDGDIPEKRVLRIEINLTGDPVQILQDERKLHAFLFSQVPKEKQHLFSITYRMP